MTLWPFRSVVCFSLPHCKIFVAPRLSTAYCLHLLGVVALILFPLAAAFASENIWVRESVYREQPHASFAHDVAVVLGGDGGALGCGDAVGWSTNSRIRALLPPVQRVPTVRSSAVDADFDGVPESLRLEVRMPTGNMSKGYRHVSMLAVYSVELRDRARVVVAGLVALDLDSPYLATGVSVRGQLKLSQTLPFRITAEPRRAYASSPLVLDHRVSSKTTVSFKTILEQYAGRNDTFTLERAVPPAWDYSPDDAFTIKVIIDVPPQMVHYTPGALEILKFAWMQVLSFAAPTWIIVQGVKCFAFENHIVDSYMISHLPSK